jgi:transporter family-2 protein
MRAPMGAGTGAPSGALPQVTRALLAPAGALLAGAGLAVQVAVNARLRAHLAHPVLAALVSFVVGTAALAAAAAALGMLRADAAAVRQAAAAPWWAWAGGLCGAYYVFTGVVLTPRLGPALYFGLLVTGQLVTSLVLEHRAWLGVPAHPMSAGRLAGVALLLAGVALVRRA